MFAILKQVKAFLFLLLLFPFGLIESSPNKTFFLISTPRSLSTAFVRMMTERGDFECFSEPAMPLYFRAQHPEIEWNFNKKAFKSFEDMQQSFEQILSKKNLFIKEFGKRILPLLQENPEYYQDPQTYFIFLIRPPHKVAISLTKGLNAMPSSSFTEESLRDLVMHNELWEMYQIIKENCINSPKIIFSDELCKKPEKTVRAICDFVQIPFDSSHLNWNPSSLAKLPNWHENKESQDILIWNNEVLQSQGFQTKHVYCLDESGLPSFSEIEDFEQRKIVQRAAFYQGPYYELFVREQNGHLKID